MQEERHNSMLTKWEFLKLEHNNNNLRALSCFHESVDIMVHVVSKKNCCNDNIGSLPKSAATFERAMHAL